MKKNILFLFLLLFHFALANPSAQAQSPWREEGSYGSQVRAKFVYGLANFFGGWIAVIHEPVTAHQEDKNVWLGMGKGLVNAVLITGGGFLHGITAPLTFIDFPLPGGGVDL